MPPKGYRKLSYKLKRGIVESKITAKLCDPSEQGTMTDLFGDPVKIAKTHPKRGDNKAPVVTVAFKMSNDEYKKLCRMAEKFGISNSRYCRDAVRQMLHDHECILQP